MIISQILTLKFYFSRQITESLIYINELEKDVTSKLENVLPDMNKDPTLSRSTVEECPKCGYNEAVYFQAELTAKSERLQLIYVCCKCGMKWQV